MNPRNIVPVELSPPKIESAVGVLAEHTAHHGVTLPSQKNGRLVTWPGRPAPQGEGGPPTCWQEALG
jgi:hypothetical protein